MAINRIKSEIWNKYIGEDSMGGICFKCEIQDITIYDYYVENVFPNDADESMRPICKQCYENLTSTYITKDDLNYYVKYVRMYLDKLPTEELNIIADVCNINEDSRVKVIRKLVNIKFDYEQFIRNILTQGSETKLRLLCELCGLNEQGTKKQLIIRLIKYGITVDEITNHIDKLYDDNLENDEFYDSDDDIYEDNESDLVSKVIKLLKSEPYKQHMLVNENVDLDLFNLEPSMPDSDNEINTIEKFSPQHKTIPLPVQNHKIIKQEILDRLDDGFDDDDNIIINDLTFNE